MNFAAIRYPGKHSANYSILGNSLPISFASSAKGLLLAPFYTNQPSFIYPLEKFADSIPSSIVAENDILPNFKVKDFNKYKEYVSAVKNFIGEDDTRKVVVSRRVSYDMAIDPESLFSSLCQTYPEAFVFFVSTREYGSWIGASPELLLTRRGKEFHSMALAGTRKIMTPKEEWDHKNRLEQVIVTKHIEETFKNHGLKVESGKTTTKNAGSIQHLMTPISGLATTSIDVQKLVSELSPTPALCGYPKKESFELIQSFEGERLLYGGFTGEIDENNDFSVFVILRCAYLAPSSVTLFAGGGITSLSSAESEWNETEYKFQTLKHFFNTGS